MSLQVIEECHRGLCNKGTAFEAAEELHRKRLCNKGTASAGPIKNAK